MAKANSDIKPLVEKLQTKEALSLADFESLLTMLREARADGRLQIREMWAILQEVFNIFDEFVTGTQQTGGKPGDFGFPKT